MTAAAFGVMRRMIAFGVSYARRGCVSLAVAVTLVDAPFHTVAHEVFDRG